MEIKYVHGANFSRGRREGDGPDTRAANLLNR